MNTDEAIQTVVDLANAFLIRNDSLDNDLKNRYKIDKIKEAITVVKGLKPSNIVDEMIDKEMNTRKKRLQLCGKHEDPKDYVPFPDEVEGIVHPD
jgi:pimeloyl-CoA synthetase